MSDHEVVPPELEDLASEVGDFICYWGFKKIHGRIWTHVYLAGQPLDAGQLMQRLRVSKALISLSINDLLRYDVVFDAGKSARGTQLYTANPDVLDVILNVLRRRERKMLAKADTGHRMLSSLSKDQMSRANLDVERIAALGRIIHQAQNALVSLLELTSLDLTGLDDLTGGEKSGQ